MSLKVRSGRAGGILSRLLVNPLFTIGEQKQGGWTTKAIWLAADHEDPNPGPVTLGLEFHVPPFKT